ncbi:uncharacterized protein LOC126335756 [Schistocerca gregaria]|uniref:uncharacterized protein LOC126335756 n=1 Tax=Schistocerca gregaria TaxID=7010 RepID=UPI00211E7CA9|nr:uncharacterized protein LOC126335756 [Schistocerca gregaria]
MRQRPRTGSATRAPPAARGSRRNRGRRGGSAARRAAVVSGPPTADGAQQLRSPATPRSLRTRRICTPLDLYLPLQIVFLSDSFAFQFTLADSSNMLDAQSQLKAHAQTARSWWRRSTHARNPGAHARGGAVSGSWWRVWRLADALLHNGC